MSEQTITMVPDERLGTISHRIFGVLVEPYGRTADGVWVGEESFIPNDGGLRLDTISAFRQLRIPVVRWPGGTVADTYHWEDGIGPRSKRPRTWNYFFGGEESNEFGTDEFLRFCEAVGAEAWIKINAQTAGLGDTVKWIQYCNYEGNTHLSNLRRENGHPKPYGVKYWSIGNEGNDAYSPEAYAEQVHQWTFHMRPADPDGRIVVTGLGGGDWNRRFLARYADLLKDGGVATKGMIHTLGLKYVDEETVKDAAVLIDEYLGRDQVDIAVEEWATRGEPLHAWPEEFERLSVWEGLLRSNELDPRCYEEAVPLSVALGGARQLHGFIRNADRVKLATFIYGTNTWEPILRTEGPRFLRTLNYHVFDLLNAHMGADSTRLEFDEDAGLDAVTSVSKDQRETILSIVNHGEEEPVDVRIRVTGGESTLPGKPESTEGGRLVSILKWPEGAPLNLG